MSYGWKYPPEHFGCDVLLRYSCGHTMTKVVTDVVLVRDIPDNMVWHTECVNIDEPCESCGGLRPAVSPWELV